MQLTKIYFIMYFILHGTVAIAGKFQGRKLSRLTSFKTVRELNFEDRLDYH